MRQIELDRAECVLHLSCGTAWALYFDNGPGGPCAQSMRTTCPHASLTTWPSEDAMRADIANKSFGRNARAYVMYGVVGEWTAGGVFVANIHQRDHK